MMPMELECMELPDVDAGQSQQDELRFLVDVRVNWYPVKRRDGWLQQTWHQQLLRSPSFSKQLHKRRKKTPVLYVSLDFRKVQETTDSSMSPNYLYLSRWRWKSQTGHRGCWWNEDHHFDCLGKNYNLSSFRFIVLPCVQSIVSNQLLKKNLKEAIDSRRIHHQLMPMEVAYEEHIDKVIFYSINYFR